MIELMSVCGVVLVESTGESIEGVVMGDVVVGCGGVVGSGLVANGLDSGTATGSGDAGRMGSGIEGVE